jgi:hypothetical protein
LPPAATLELPLAPEGADAVPDDLFAAAPAPAEAGAPARPWLPDRALFTPDALAEPWGDGSARASRR